jgi:hypothetical protein
MCELEMLARTAEAKAKENASFVARIEEAIRTQLLARRWPHNQSAAPDQSTTEKDRRRSDTVGRF